MNKSRILGITFDVYVTSACLLEDGKVVAACPEERLTRRKLTKEFPVEAINYCLNQGNCKLSDVDYIAVGWNPGIHINQLNYRFSGVNRWRGEQLYSIPNYLLSIQGDERVHQVIQEITTEHSKIKIIYVDHHKAHAALFYLSPFREAAIMTCDGRGEEDTLTLNIGNNNKITELDRYKFPHSLGMLYGAVTQFLGFKRDSDEWKVMALYSYSAGKHNPCLKKFRELVTLLPCGRFELNLNYFSYYLHDVKTWYSDKFIEEFGEPRGKGSEFEEKYLQIAHALQLVTEEALSHSLRYLYESTKLNKLVVSGGTFMNSVFNGKITEVTPFKEVFVSSCPDDSGVSIGAALHVYHDIFKGGRSDVMNHNYYGPGYSNEEIKKELDNYKLQYTTVDNIEEFTAGLLAKGEIIGWFQGRMEFGQRALGNRSILADPRLSSMKDELNARIKYREWFRPFAPAILGERVEEYFEVHGPEEVRFMEKVYKIKSEKTGLIPAVAHVDGSGRLQTVDREQNPRFHKLISEFDKLTGVPVIVNTSFNLNGEPIVCTPTDAIKTFYACGLDALVLGNYVIEKVEKERG